MSVSAEQIVVCARGWVGTRFAHQGRRKKSAGDAGSVDCLGLLVGVADELGLMRDGRRLADQDETHYGHYPDSARLQAGLLRWLLKVAEKECVPGEMSYCWRLMATRSIWALRAIICRRELA